MKAYRYPEAVATDSGCKVGWRYYKDRQTAEKAARMAVEEAETLERLGYDFGFSCPGDLQAVTEGEYRGLWRVCIP